MIPRSVLNPKWIIPSTEPVLTGIDERVARQYLLSRDLSVLSQVEGKQWDETAGRLGDELVSMFQIQPLTQDQWNYVELLDAHPAEAAKSLVRKCVTAARNFAEFKVKILADGSTEVTDETIAAIGVDTCMDLASVIRSLAGGVDGVHRAFFCGVGWQRERFASLSLRAMRAQTEAANETP